ncbi:hypothetical protein Tco_1006945 [Tanacetum coccineum]|uniref:Uncharacterized protein n=1 Tax=Tanacetum coccineum TaxID=301880 RepID=A0ABQ5FLM6_9ASTR
MLMMSSLQHLSDDDSINTMTIDQELKEEHDIWAWEMEHYLVYIDAIDAWKEHYEEDLMEWMNAKEILGATRTKVFGGSSSSFSSVGSYVLEVSLEDANYKFLRSLPPTWSNLVMTMRTKPDVDTLSIDDLYNNLRVFEQEIQGASKTSSSAQNVAFVSQSKSSTDCSLDTQ